MYLYCMYVIQMYKHPFIFIRFRINKAKVYALLIWSMLKLFITKLRQTFSRKQKTETEDKWGNFMNQNLKIKVTIGDILHSKWDTNLFSFMEKMKCMSDFFYNYWYVYALLKEWQLFHVTNFMLINIKESWVLKG